MAVRTVDEFLGRARSARDTPTLYWLGWGGWKDHEPEGRRPGTPIDAAAELARLRQDKPRVHAAYLAGAAAAGIDLAALPDVACDCSGFVAWALGIARHPIALNGQRDTWFFTNAIHADALGRQQALVRLPAAVVGAMLVYPGIEAEEKIGHIGIVTEVQDGRAVRMLHCAPENFALPPVDGARHAIAETGTERMDAERDTVVAWWKGFGPPPAAAR